MERVTGPLIYEMLCVSSVELSKFVLPGNQFERPLVKETIAHFNQLRSSKNARQEMFPPSTI